MGGNVSVKQIFQGFIALIVLIALLWLAFYALILVLIIAAIGTVYYFIRRILASQGIINTPEPYGDTPDNNVTVIETDYQDVTENKNDST